MHQSISRYIYKMYKCDHIMPKIHPTMNIGVYNFVQELLSSPICCCVWESSTDREGPLWSWPRPRLACSSASKSKSFCMSIKGLSQTGKHQDVSLLSWPRGWWNILAKRQVRVFWVFFLPGAIQARQEKAPGGNRQEQDGRVFQLKSWRKWRLGLQIQTGKECIDG